MILENRSRRRLRGMKTVFLLLFLLLLFLLFESLDRALVEVSLLPNSHIPSPNFSLLPVSRSNLFRSLLDFRSSLRRQGIHLYFSSLFPLLSPISHRSPKCHFSRYRPSYNPDVWRTRWTISTQSTGKLNEELIPSKYLGISDSWSKLRMNNSFPFPQPSYRT